MKKFLLFLSFLLFSSFLSLAAELPNPVLDFDGDEVRTGVQYYIVSSIRGAGGGGVNFGRSVRNTNCPQSVVQEGSDLNSGHPVTFTPVNPEEGVVRVSTDLNIKFTNPAVSNCNQSNVWMLDFVAELREYFIATDGVEGNPGCETWANWFKIEAVGDFGYKLVFCPRVCDIAPVSCQDFGIFFDQGIRRLALFQSRPFLVTIFKARSMKNENILKSVTST